jgi:hypothetical protein
MPEEPQDIMKMSTSQTHVSLIGTLVKSDTTSELTIISCGPARREPNVGQSL